jgi:hypothetical protein
MDEAPIKVFTTRTGAAQAAKALRHTFGWPLERARGQWIVVIRPLRGTDVSRHLREDGSIR